MIVTNQTTIIPKQGEIRDMLRNEARLFVYENKIRPPVDFITLESQAKRLLKNLNLDDNFLEYAIVITANEVWSEVFSATLFNRRLLLLPQCLRNKNSCSGVFDDMGLVCAGCNNCNINQVLEEAESLGYTTLVADGTSVAITLVEEGAIDAVIGVGCMIALKQSFRPVNHAAVPAIALPLLFDGCENTSLDYSWLSEEIKKFKPNSSITPLSVSSLKIKVSEYFSTQSLKKFFSEDTEIERLALSVMENGGQRLRPLLLLIAYLSYSEEDIDGLCSTLAVIIECFHKASLIHDDIQDGSDTRYDKPALYTTEGIPVAINIGDYLIGKGYRLLSGIQCDPVILTECFRVVSESHLKMSEGQDNDIKLSERITRYSPGDLMHIYKLKTGEAVKVSLLLGAVLGNASVGELKYLKSFSEWFGIAYQIRDDLTEYREKKDHDHPLNFPFLLTLLKEETAGTDFLLTKFIDTPENNQLRIKLEEYRIEEKAVGCLNECIKKCYLELDNLQNYKLCLSLYGVIGKVFKEYKI